MFIFTKILIYFYQKILKNYILTYVVINFVIEPNEPKYFN